MNPKDGGDQDNNFFYSTDDGETWKPFGHVDRIDETSSGDEELELEIAKTWAMAMGGLEIVPRGEE